MAFNKVIILLTNNPHHSFCVQRLLEVTLGDIVSKLRAWGGSVHGRSPHETRRLTQQQAAVQRETSRVTQDLAHASKVAYY